MAITHWQIALNKKIELLTPQGILTDAMAYFKYCDDHPIENPRLITSGKGTGVTLQEKLIRPYSIKGLCLHCGMTEEYIRDVRHSKTRTSDMYVVISRLIYIIYVQNQELATVGVFNPIFTAKLLNLDREDIPNGAVTVNIVQGLPTLANSESEILEKLDLENGKIINMESKNS